MEPRACWIIHTQLVWEGQAGTNHRGPPPKNTTWHKRMTLPAVAVAEGPLGISPGTPWETCCRLQKIRPASLSSLPPERFHAPGIVPAPPGCHKKLFSFPSIKTCELPAFDLYLIAHEHNITRSSSTLLQSNNISKSSWDIRPTLPRTHTWSYGKVCSILILFVPSCTFVTSKYYSDATKRYSLSYKTDCGGACLQLLSGYHFSFCDRLLNVKIRKCSKCPVIPMLEFPGL